MSTERYARNPSAMEVEIADRLVLFDPEAGQFCDLNGTGRAIWEMLAEPSALSDVAQRVSQRYLVTPETCQPEIGLFLETLQRSGFVTEPVVSLQSQG